MDDRAKRLNGEGRAERRDGRHESEFRAKGEQRMR